MARDFESSSSERITYTSPATLDYSSGCTFSILCNQESSDTTHKRAYELWDASSNFVAQLQFDNGTAGQTIAVFQRSDNSNVYRISDGHTTTGTWIHWVVTYDGGTAGSGIHIYKDNSEVSYATTNDGTGSARNADGTWYVGMRSTIPDRFYDGILAEFAAWNRVLGSGEIAALYNRLSADIVAPDYIFYAKMIRDANNRTNNSAPTLTGTTVAAHPRVIYPVPQLYIPTNLSAAPEGRTTKNTDAFPLGVHTGMAWRINQP